MSTTLAQSQWTDLGIHTEACITQGNCASGALSMWLKVIKCDPLGGIISTYSYTKTRGFYLHCYFDKIAYVSLENLIYSFAILAAPSAVINYSSIVRNNF